MANTHCGINKMMPNIHYWMYLKGNTHYRITKWCPTHITECTWREIYITELLDSQHSLQNYLMDNTHYRKYTCTCVQHSLQNYLIANTHCRIVWWPTHITEWSWWSTHITEMLDGQHTLQNCLMANKYCRITSLLDGQH